jgi:hypothetical protein
MPHRRWFLIRAGTLMKPERSADSLMTGEMRALV